MRTAGSPNTRWKEGTGSKPAAPLPADEQILFDYFGLPGSHAIDKATGAEINDRRGKMLAAISGASKGTFFNNNIGYVGLLSTLDSTVGGGPLEQFLVQIPQAIAETLANGATPATLAADWSALLAEFAPNAGTLAVDALSGL